MTKPKHWNVKNILGKWPAILKFFTSGLAMESQNHRLDPHFPGDFPPVAVFHRHQLLLMSGLIFSMDVSARKTR